MFKRVLQAALFILGFFLIAIFQFAAIANWPFFFSQLNVVLIFLIFCLFFLGRRAAIIGALASGFFLDIFSFHFFGLYIISFFLVVMAAERISIGLLTNRSLYSFCLLILISTLAYNLIVNLLSLLSLSVTSGFFLGQKDFWLPLAYQGIWSLLSAVLLFNLATLLTRSFQPFFLEKESKL